jgi:hypothetical protein
MQFPIFDLKNSLFNDQSIFGRVIRVILSSCIKDVKGKMFLLSPTEPCIVRGIAEHCAPRGSDTLLLSDRTQKFDTELNITSFRYQDG